MSEPNDTDWLLARERGDDVSHVPAATRAKYDRLARLIRALPGQAPSPGWKQQVLDALDELPERSAPHACPAARPTPASQPAQPPGARTSPPRRRPGIQSLEPSAPGRTTWTTAGGALAVAATGLVLALAIHTIDEGSEPLPTIASVTVRRNSLPHRGNGVNIGDTLVVEAQAHRSIELRVYGDAGEPLARCNETAGCAVERAGDRRRFRLELPLASPGCVRTILLVGDSIPPAFHDLDADLEAAGRAKIETRSLSCTHVQ